jgi:hypothetical protein
MSRRLDTAASSSSQTSQVNQYAESKRPIVLIAYDHRRDIFERNPYQTSGGAANKHLR